MKIEKITDILKWADGKKYTIEYDNKCANVECWLITKQTERFSIYISHWYLHDDYEFDFDYRRPEIADRRKQLVNYGFAANVFYTTQELEKFLNIIDNLLDIKDIYRDGKKEDLEFIDMLYDRD